MKEAGIESVYWDRQGKAFHGRAAAFAGMLQAGGVRLGEK